MGFEICDLDRTYAQRIVQAVFQCHVIQVAEGMRQGDCLKLHAPDYRAHDAAAKILAELREAYLGPERERRQHEDRETAMPKKTREELLKGMHRGRNNHLDDDIIDTYNEVTSIHGLRDKLKASMKRLIAASRAANGESAEVRAELINDFEKNLDAWIAMHGL